MEKPGQRKKTLVSQTSSRSNTVWFHWKSHMTTFKQSDWLKVMWLDLTLDMIPLKSHMTTFKQSDWLKVMWLDLILYNMIPLKVLSRLVCVQDVPFFSQSIYKVQSIRVLVTLLLYVTTDCPWANWLKWASATLKSHILRTPGAIESSFFFTAIEVGVVYRQTRNVSLLTSDCVGMYYQSVVGETRLMFA